MKGRWLLGTLPDDWLRASVIAVFQSGDKLTAGNDRSISLTFVPSKIIDHIHSRYIRVFLEENNVLYHYYHGFRPVLSTVTELDEVTHDITSSFNEKQQVDLICIYFSKAFGRVPHERLVQKCKILGLHSGIVKWIEAYL